MSAKVCNLALSVAVLALAGANPASAQVDLLDPGNFSGMVQIGLSTASGEASWVEGNYGRFNVGKGQVRPKGELGLAWSPRLSQSTKLVVVAEAQSDQHHPVDLSEAYLTWHRQPPDPVGVSVKAGMYWPAFSLEHDDLVWTTQDTLTPSATNTWIAEEAKVGGMELTLATAFADIPVRVTGGVFGWADTSGTILTFRGWAMHGLKSTGEAAFKLPPRLPFQSAQADRTRPFREVDGRAGVYGSVNIEPRAGLQLTWSSYDNHGNPLALEAGQYGWDTRFQQIALKAPLATGLELKSQILVGNTQMGPVRFGSRALDVDFRSGFVSLSREVGSGSFTGRFDRFLVLDRSFRNIDDNSEHGSAVTLAYRWDVKPGTQLFFEAGRSDSLRPSRNRTAEDPHQDQTQLSTALRVNF